MHGFWIIYTKPNLPKSEPAHKIWTCPPILESDWVFRSFLKCTDFELFIPSQICQNLNLPTISEPAHLFWNRTESLDLCCYPRGVFHPSDSCNVAKASASDNFPLCILSSLFYQRFFSTFVSAHLGAREIFSMPSKTCPPNLNLPTVDNGQR